LLAGRAGIVVKFMQFHVAFSLAGIPTLRRDAGNAAFLVDSGPVQTIGGRYTVWNGEARISEGFGVGPLRDTGADIIIQWVGGARILFVDD
jgi:hypothetical protein